MMLIQVVMDLSYFIILFIIFILTFAECYHIVQIDVSSYGRMPDLLALSLATQRSSFGDFSLIDPYMGFDLTDEQEDGTRVHRHSQVIMIFTFIIFYMQAFILFMIFMNFIIAVINDSYAKINQYSVAHDY